jgi:hypothetical protein
MEKAKYPTWNVMGIPYKEEETDSVLNEKQNSSNYRIKNETEWYSGNK